MQVFVSWSGTRSRTVASALREWLPNVIQSVDPFMSSKDIAAGNRWQTEIASRLDSSIFGLVCVTRENQHSPWLNFEAGALAKTVVSARVVPIAIDLTPADIDLPLAQFQAQTLDRDGIWKTVVSINEHSEPPLSDAALQGSFEKWWPALETQLDVTMNADEDDETVPERKDRELLEEVLDTVRDLARNVNRPGVPSEQEIAAFMKEIHESAPSASTAHTSGTNLVSLISQEPLNAATVASIQRIGKLRGIRVVVLPISDHDSN